MSRERYTSSINFWTILARKCATNEIANAIVKMDFMSPGNEFTESNTPKKKDGGGGLDAVTNREKKPSIGMILLLFR